MTRPDAPGPFRRRGPRPLWLHLTGLPQPAPEHAVPPLPAELDPALVAGIAAYRRHPYSRTLVDPPAIWAEGDSRLLDYGGDARAPAALFVPSLVNRAYVLDLLPERSMLRWLAASGVRPLLLDWGWPGPDDRRLDLSSLIDRLLRAMATLAAPLVLVGYCMGGLLATAAAARAPVRGLALLATPWDFHAGQALTAATIDRALADGDAMLEVTGTLPVDALQALFARLSPGAVAAKFRAFATADPASAASRDFVALEDWLNDGVPLAAPVAREVFRDWYRDNRPGRGTWRAGGVPVRPEALACPAFAAVPRADRIVPPDSALALATRLPGCTLHRPAAGHIGMTAGPRAEAMLWQPLLGWLQAIRPPI